MPWHGRKLQLTSRISVIIQSPQPSPASDSITDTGSWSPRLERFKQALACPQCAGELSYSDTEARCVSCGQRYPQRGGKLYFVQPPASDDTLDSLKHRLKRALGRLYYSLGVTLIAPTYPFNFRAAIRRHCDPAQALCVDIGCGNQRIDPDILCLDMFDYEAVDIVCDLRSLPFKPESVDAFVSRSVLEHVPRLEEVASQLKRSTRSGGFSIHLIPFLFPYHASPHDYQRLTASGAEALFEGWVLVEQRAVTGPMTLFLLWLVEFLSTLASAGNERVKSYVYLALCLVLWPIKFLDAPFVGRRSFLAMAPTILTAVRKP